MNLHQQTLDFWFDQYCQANRRLWVADANGDLALAAELRQRITFCRQRFNAERDGQFNNQPKRR